MKKLFALVIAVALMFGAVSALAEADLVIYSARNERLNNIAIPAFEAATGITVEVVTGSSGEVLQRVKTEVESGAVYGDILWSADETMLYANKDLFQVYVCAEDDKLLPEFRNNGENVFTPVVAEPNVIVVNTEKLDAVGIKIESYLDLLQPELKGHIIGADPANSSSAFQSLIGALYGVGEGDPTSDKAWDFIEKLIVNMDGIVASSSSQVYNGVASGEYWVGLSYEDPCVELEYVGQQPVKVVYPVEGVVFPGESVQIIAGARHLEAAQKFVDFLLTEETQTAIASGLNLRPLREGIATNEKMISNDEVVRVPNYSATYVAEKKIELVNRYVEAVEMNME